MTKRIFFKRYDSAGKFSNGRVKLDVYFKDSQNNEYVWTPDWEKGVRSLFLEAYRIEKINRLKGPEVEKFKQTGREVSSEEEVESYDEFYGNLAKIEKGQVVIDRWIEDDSGGYRLVDERKIPLSIEFRAKIMEEAINLLAWIKRYKGRLGKWVIVNGELFDVEWEG